MNKSELRKIMSVKRNSLTDEEKIYKSRKIFENLLDTSNLADVSCIFIFVSYRSECDTTPIIDYCIDNGIKVAVPRVNGDKMDFYVIREFGLSVEGLTAYHSHVVPCLILAKVSFYNNIFIVKYSRLKIVKVSANSENPLTFRLTGFVVL